MDTTLRSLSALLTVSLFACAQVPVAPAAPVPPGATSKSYVAWGEATADLKVVDGLMPLRQRGDGSLLAELSRDQLDLDFGLAKHIRSGPSDFDLQPGLIIATPQIVRFTRVGDRVLVCAQPQFLANAEPSVLSILNLVSEDVAGGKLLLDITPLLIGADAAVASTFESYFKPDQAPRFDDKRSSVRSFAAFPGNDEFDVVLSYALDASPPVGGEGMSDRASLAIGVRFSLFTLPEHPMQPRREDDRVGYFAVRHWDASQPPDRTAVVSYIWRRRLDRPNVYYIDRSVPEKWRRYVREGVLAWNEAFESAGRPGALEVRDAPDDPAWNADDIRYTTISWLSSHDASYGAVGLSSVDPRTGEILSSRILIAAAMLRSITAPTERMFNPGQSAARADACAAGASAAQSVAIGAMLLAGLGDREFSVSDDFTGDALRSLVIHEIGHTLGLRHNFRGSANVPLDKLQDQTWTRANGLSGSIMDYACVNVGTDPAHQGDYFDRGVCEYDRWAIRYGYSEFAPDAEEVGLSAIAAQSNQTGHEYGADEDYTGMGADALDPLTGWGDLGDDAIGWAAQRTELMDRTIAKLPKLIGADQPWSDVRAMLGLLIGGRWRPLDGEVRVVGGIEVHRDHHGQPGARPAFTPVAPAQQRLALAHIVDKGFVAGTWAIDPTLVNELVREHDLFDLYTSQEHAPIDYPIHRVVLAEQSKLLDALLDPARLARIVDNTVRTPGADRFELSELFAKLSDGICTEILGDPTHEIDSMRRNAQRAYFDRLIRLTLPGAQPAVSMPDEPDLYWRAKSPAKVVPEDARSLARWNLVRLDQALSKAVKAGAALSVETQAHLAESQTRIERALAASIDTAP
jgi:hypothetical protein